VSIPALEPMTVERLRASLPVEIRTQLVELFAASAPADIADMRDAVARGDAGELMRVAHRGKGGSATLGAARMADACSRLQATGETGDLSSAPEQLDRLDDAWRATQGALAERLLAA